jgi:hypothetical protein
VPCFWYGGFVVFCGFLWPLGLLFGAFLGAFLGSFSTTFGPRRQVWCIFVADINAVLDLAKFITTLVSEVVAKNA